MMRVIGTMLVLVLVGCANPRKERPDYSRPESRDDASRWLIEALDNGDWPYSEINGDRDRITWNERWFTSGKDPILVERELTFSAINIVHHATEDGRWWEVLVDASGGNITFRFKDGQQAAKAEVALKRLAEKQETPDDR